MAGVGPAATYQAAVQGLDDGEVNTVRRVAGMAFPPRSRLRSLTLLHLWHGMPTAAAEVAATLQLARAVWTAVLAGSAKPRHHGFDLPGIRAAWQEVHENREKFLDDGQPDDTKRRKWKSSRGPISAAMLELDRVGWTYESPFVWRTDLGVQVILTNTPPSMLKDMLCQAVKRKAERSVARRWAQRDVQFLDGRVCVDAAAAALARDKLLTPLQKGAYVSAMVGGVMTNDRAAKLGHDVSNACPLCGEAGHTIHHRVYCCQHTRAKVQAVVPKWFWQESQRAAATDLFWTTGIMPHPADAHPPPRDDYKPLAVDANDEPLDDPYLEGHIFVDGSCSTSLFPGLQRAALAVVQVDEEANLQKAVSVPIWNTLPQTPQASECAALAAVASLLKGPSQVYGDCTGVVDAYTRGPAHYTRGERKYAGVMLSMHRHPAGLKFIESMSKVKAHQNIGSLECTREQWLAKSNQLADEAAKKARARHPQMDADLDAKIRFWMKRVPHIVRAVATAMAEFPPAGAKFKRRAADKAPRDRDREAAPGDRHDWAFVEGRWRCSRCWTYVRGGTAVPAARKMQQCPGDRATAAARSYEENGHTLLLAQGDVPIAFCAKCGAWTSRRARLLRKKCAPPTAAGRMALLLISRGLHPWRARRDDIDGERPRSKLVAHAAWKRASRTWAKRTQGREAVQVAGCSMDAERVAHDAAAVASPVTVVAASADDASDRPPELEGDRQMEEEEEDPFGHGFALDQLPVPAEQPPAKAARTASPTTSEVAVAAAAVTADDAAPTSTVSRDPRLRGVSMHSVISALRDASDRLGPHDCTAVFNVFTGRVLKTTIGALEAERDVLRVAGRTDYDRTPTCLPGLGGTAPCDPVVAIKDGHSGEAKSAGRQLPPCKRPRREDCDEGVICHPIYSTREQLLQQLRGCGSSQSTNGSDGAKANGNGSAAACAVDMTAAANSHPKKPRTGTWTYPTPREVPPEATGRSCGGQDADAQWNEAIDAVRDKRAVAREGPRDAAAGVAAAAVFTAAAAATPQPAVILDPRDSARGASTPRGETAMRPADGYAAPSDPVVTVCSTHGCDFARTSSTKPVAEGGRGPPNWREGIYPQTMPAEDLGAGARQTGRELVDRVRRWPTNGVVRRRDGDGQPAASSTAARGSGGAAVRGSRGQLVQSWAYRDDGARRDECSICSPGGAGTELRRPENESNGRFFQQGHEAGGIRLEANTKRRRLRAKTPPHASTSIVSQLCLCSNTSGGGKLKSVDDTSFSACTASASAPARKDAATASALGSPVRCTANLSDSELPHLSERGGV